MFSLPKSELNGFVKQNEDEDQSQLKAPSKQQKMPEQDYLSRPQKLECSVYLSRIGMDLQQICDDYGVTRDEITAAQLRPVDMFQGKIIHSNHFSKHNT